MSILTRTALAALIVGAAVGAANAQQVSATRQIQVLPAPQAAEQAAPAAQTDGPGLASAASTPARAPAAAQVASADPADPADPAPAQVAAAPTPAADPAPAAAPSEAPVVVPVAPKVVVAPPAKVIVKPVVRERYGYTYAEAPRYHGGYGGYSGYGYRGGYRAEKCH